MQCTAVCHYRLVPGSAPIISLYLLFCQGQLKSTLSCPVCSTESQTFENFTSLGVPLPAVVDGAVELAKCFDLFTSTEVLSADNQWLCSKCKEPRQARKRLELWRLPRHLVIQLKRFKVRASCGKRCLSLLPARRGQPSRKNRSISQVSSAVFQAYNCQLARSSGPGHDL